MSRAVFALVALLALGGCDPFPEVKKQDTIEAYEGYLKEHPDSNYAIEAKARLEQLYIDKARAEKSLEAYDAYIDRFPNGIFRKAAYEEREQHLWEWADETNTAEAWDKYVEAYPSHDAKKVKEARRRKDTAIYLPNLSWTDVRLEQVNLAEDPEGPLNGWLISTDVTNKGDKTLTYLQMTARYVDDEGKTLGSAKWPVVSQNYGIPVEPEKKEPMKPGDTRTWELMTGDVPEGWNKKVKLVATGIKFEELKAR